MQAMPHAISLTVRSLVATLGAYASSVLAALLVSRLLPMDLGPATMAGMLLSFWVFTGCAMWAFASRSALTACSGLSVFCTTCLLGITLL